MDRRVKERLIGASILVALVVLVVPELLSGPKPAAAPAPTLPAAAPEPIRNVTVDLTTSKPPANSDGEPAASQAASAAAGSPIASAANVPATQKPAPSSAPIPAPSAVPAPAPAPRGSTPSTSAPSSAATKPASRQAPARRLAVESAPSSPTSTGHGSWSVQLGSFASRANAENLTRQVKGQGFSAFVLPGGSGNSVRYRVRVGPLSDRESAERMAAKLKALGHVGSLVAPAA